MIPSKNSLYRIDSERAIATEVDKILGVGDQRLVVMGEYARRGCRSCGGNGYGMYLRRAGATSKEPRDLRICGCSMKSIRKEAMRRLQSPSGEEKR